MFDRSHQEYHRHIDDSRERTTIPDISRSPSVTTHDLDIMLDRALGRAHISIPVAPPPPPPVPMSSKQQHHRSPSPAPRIPRTRHDGDLYHEDILMSRVDERRDQSRRRSPAPRYYDRRDDDPSFTVPRRNDVFEHGDHMDYHRRPDHGPAFEPGPRPYNYRPDYRREDNRADERTEYRSNCGHGFRSDHDDYDFRFKNRYDQWYDDQNPTRTDYDNYDPRERFSPDGYRDNVDSRNHHYEREPPPRHQSHGEKTTPAQPYSSTINITLVGEQPHVGGATRQVLLHSSGTMTPPMTPSMSDWRDVDDRVAADDTRNSTRHRCWHWSRNNKK